MRNLINVASDTLAHCGVENLVRIEAEELRSGAWWVTFTPVPGSPGLGGLRKLVFSYNLQHQPRWLPARWVIREMDPSPSQEESDRLQHVVNTFHDSALRRE